MTHPNDSGTSPKTEEPALAQEEDVAVDRKDTEGEAQMREVRNDKLGQPGPASAPPKAPAALQRT